MNQINRRTMLQSTGVAAALLAATRGGFTRPAYAADSTTDSMPMQLYKGLSEEQRHKICLPVDQ